MPDKTMSAEFNVTPQKVDAVVVGAGFAGLYMLYLLRDKLKLNVVALEAADGVGGVWYWNRYPGARCDIAAAHYSYSFSKELEQEWVWPEKYPDQPTILKYLEHVADRFDLTRDIQFDTRVEIAEFDDKEQRWLVTTKKGDQYSAQYFVPAVGILSDPKIPQIKGHENFKGGSCFSGRWPKEGVDFAGKNVGIIGTGATAVQAIPVIAETAAHLTVFQRTPYFAVPLQNKVMTEAEDKRMKASYAKIRKHDRESVGGMTLSEARPSAMADTPEQRKAHYEQRYKEGTFNLWVASYDDLIYDRESNETAAEFVRSKIRERVTDPEIAELLCPPKGITFGTKRQPCETGYFEAYNRDNVTLVDLNQTPIEEIVSEGMRTSDQTHELDYLIFATGYDAFTGSYLKMNITGRNGLALKDHWSNGPRSYFGLSVTGFPNMFIITGPQSPSAFYNFPLGIERHCDWIADCIVHTNGRGMAAVDVEQKREEEWVAKVTAIAEETLFPQASSWYMGDNIPGKPRAFAIYLGDGQVFYEMIEREAADKYPSYNFVPKGGEKTGTEASARVKT